MERRATRIVTDADNAVRVSICCCRSIGGQNNTMRMFVLSY